jgi:hypothetical protein
LIKIAVSAINGPTKDQEQRAAQLVFHPFSNRPPILERPVDHLEHWDSANIADAADRIVAVANAPLCF